MSFAVSVIGTGAVTPVGLRAPSSCAAIRAGIKRFTETGFRDRVRGPTHWAMVPLRPGPLDGDRFGRLTALGSLALQECLEMTGLRGISCPVLLGVSEPRPESCEDDRKPEALLESISIESGLSRHRASAIFAEGRASIFSAAFRARELLRLGHAQVCVIGAVDSLLNPFDMQRLGDNFRLKSDEIAQGLIPSEGAAFLALRAAPYRQGECELVGLGLAQEPAAHTVLADGSSSGSGLQQAVEQALSDAGLAEQMISGRITDVNGETYRTHENMLVMGRAYRSYRPQFPHLVPAAQVGDCGAAAGALLLVVADAALRKGYAGGSLVMCEASSDAGLRAACLIQRAQ